MFEPMQFLLGLPKTHNSHSNSLNFKQAYPMSEHYNKASLQVCLNTTQYTQKHFAKPKCF